MTPETLETYHRSVIVFPSIEVVIDDAWQKKFILQAHVHSRKANVSFADRDCVSVPINGWGHGFIEAVAGIPKNA